jgi:hypothetical protein
MVLRDRNIRGTGQGNIKHVSRIRLIAHIRVLKPPKAKNYPPNRSLGVHLPQVWTGTWANFFTLPVIF